MDAKGMFSIIDVKQIPFYPSQIDSVVSGLNKVATLNLFPHHLFETFQYLRVKMNINSNKNIETFFLLSSFILVYSLLIF